MRNRHEKWERVSVSEGNELISQAKNYLISHGIERERLMRVPMEVIKPRNSWRHNHAPVRHPVKGLVFVGHTGVIVDSKTQTKSVRNEPATEIKFHTNQDEVNRHQGHSLTFPNKAPTIYFDDELSAGTKVVDIKYENIDFDNKSTIIPDQLLIFSKNTPGKKTLSRGSKYNVEMTIVVLEENFYQEIISDKNNPALRNLRKVLILPTGFILERNNLFAFVNVLR